MARKRKKITEQQIWMSVSEAANIAGVTPKTIRRAIKEVGSGLSFKIVNDRYQIEFRSLINYMHSNTKLNNKFLEYGIGQYIEEWDKKMKL